MGSLRGPWGGLGGPWGYLGGPLGVPWGPPGGTLGSLGGSQGGPACEFECSWQLWKLLKNHWFLLCFELWEGPGDALEGPCGVAGRPGVPSGAIGEAPRGSLGVSGGVGGLKARILGGCVITWGGLWGGFGGPGGAPRGYDYHLAGSGN